MVQCKQLVWSMQPHLRCVDTKLENPFHDSLLTQLTKWFCLEAHLEPWTRAFVSLTWVFPQLCSFGTAWWEQTFQENQAEAAFSLMTCTWKSCSITFTVDPRGGTTDPASQWDEFQRVTYRTEDIVGLFLENLICCRKVPQRVTGCENTAITLIVNISHWPCQYFLNSLNNFFNSSFSSLGALLNLFMYPLGHKTRRPYRQNVELFSFNIL